MLPPTHDSPKNSTTEIATERQPASELRIRRMQVGYRIQDLHEHTGLSTTRISEIERNSGRRASNEELNLIYTALGAAEGKHQP